MIGLGRMGGNMARRLARRGIFVHAFSLDTGANADLGNEENVQTLARQLSPGDIVIDGGKVHFHGS